MDGAFAQRLVERGGDRDARDRLRRYRPGRLMVVPAALDLYPPGVRLIGGRRRAPIRGVLHDVAGFSGIAERGPEKPRSEEHTSELQSLMRNSYAVFCLEKKKRNHII